MSTSKKSETKSETLRGKTSAKRVSNRTLIFKVLSRAGDRGMPADAIRERIHMDPSNGAFRVILRGEVAAKRVRLMVREDGRYYALTARGRKDLEADAVDSNARKLGVLALGRPWDHREEANGEGE